MPDQTEPHFSLSEERRATLQALELAATLGHFGNSLDAVENEYAILSETAAKLNGLVDFSSMSVFLAHETTFAFNLAWSSHPELHEDIVHEVDVLIEDRTFAWALGRNKPSVVTGQKMGRLLLHPLSTASGPLGMFVGVLQDNSDESSSDIGYYLLTVTLFASATLLENFRLFRHLEQANTNLELQVADRTKKLTASNVQLRKTLEEKEHYRQNLEAVFASMQDPLITVDRDRRILSINRAGEQFFSTNAANLTGIPFSGLRWAGAEACMQVFTNTIDLGQTVREFRTQYKLEGIDKVVILSCSPLMSATGTLDGGVLLIRDITRLATLEKQLKERHSFRNIVGKSARMQQLYTLLESLAEVDTTVLVTGESGTGKELVADALHHNGARSGGPLIKVNCTALSESLLESELFGHTRGSFTGAVSDKAGRFEAAEGGTIFLDEIGDVSPRIQILLLRFLESKEFERVGDTQTRKADVRIVAATNANLRQKIHEGTFRADLYYRLNVMHVHLPPLRERRDDIPLLLNHFLRHFNEVLGTDMQGITEEAMQFFMRHPWSGNVRELKHAVEHACILARTGLIGMDHLTPEILAPFHAPMYTNGYPASPANGPYGALATHGGYPHPVPEQITQAASALAGYLPSNPGLAMPPSGPRTIHQPLTAENITAAIRYAGGNKARAARLLGIGRATLYRKMHELGLKP